VALCFHEVPRLNCRLAAILSNCIDLVGLSYKTDTAGSYVSISVLSPVLSQHFEQYVSLKGFLRAVINLYRKPL